MALTELEVETLSAPADGAPPPPPAAMEASVAAVVLSVQEESIRSGAVKPGIRDIKLWRSSTTAAAGWSWKPRW